MKQVLFALFVIAGLTACNGSASTEEAVKDSVVVDSTAVATEVVVDSTKVDSVAAPVK